MAFDRLEQALVDADLVISTTAASEPIVTLEQYIRVQRVRRNRLSLILDIAFPRDFDPRIGTLDQVMLYHIDELRAQAEQNRLSRQKGIDPALAIIERRSGCLLLAVAAPARRRTPARATGQSRRPDSPARAFRVVFQPARLDRGRPRGDRAHGYPAAEPVPPSSEGGRALGSDRAACTDHGHPHSVLAFVRHIFGLGERSAELAEEDSSPRNDGVTMPTFVLTDASSELWVDSKDIDPQALGLGETQPFSIKKHTLRGGRREGVDLIVVDNGALRFAVVPTRGMGLWKGWYEGNRLGWDSPIGDGPVNPAFVNLGAHGGLGLARGL